MAHNRILVTGASGFIGRHALTPLQRFGFEVHAVARTPPASPPDVHWHAANLLDPFATRSVLESVKPTHLLHFAWYAEHGKFWTSSMNLDWLSATLSLLKDFAELGGKRFIGAGSCAEYGWDGRTAYQENSPLQPVTLYGAAKASAFLTGQAFARERGIDFSWGRIFHLFGPDENPDRIVPALIRAHLRGQALDCSQGTQLRDFLPVSAVAEAFARLCACEAQGAFNIGSGKAVTLRDLSDKIAAFTGSKGEIRFGAFQDKGPESLLPAVERITREAGWIPPESLATGLEEAVAWWRLQL